MTCRRSAGLFALLSRSLPFSLLRQSSRFIHGGWPRDQWAGWRNAQAAEARRGPGLNGVGGRSPSRPEGEGQARPPVSGWLWRAWVGARAGAGPYAELSHAAAFGRCRWCGRKRLRGRRARVEPQGGLAAQGESASGRDMEAELSHERVACGRRRPRARQRDRGGRLRRARGAALRQVVWRAMAVARAAAGRGG
jgi:hypothetical protein